MAPASLLVTMLKDPSKKDAVDDESEDIGDIGFDDATIDDGDTVIPASKMD